MSAELKERQGTENRPELPRGWVWVTLGEVCWDPQYGWTTSASDEGELHLIRTTDITSGYINWDSVPFCKEEPPEVEKYLIKDGDIVISRAGSVGYSHLINNPKQAVFASYLIRFKPLIDRQYVAYFLKSPFYWKSISERKLGIALPNVNATKLKQISFPLPPLPEQHRIVAKIEELFTKLDVGVEALKKAQLLLKRYRQSVLKAAVEGKLTREWREAHKGELEPASVLLERILKERREKWEADEWAKMRARGKTPKDDKWKQKYKEPQGPDTDDLPDLPEGWVWTTSDTIFWFVTSGSRGWAKYYSDSGPIFLRIGNLDHDSIALDLNKIQRVKPPLGTEGTRTRVMPNDIIISITADVGMIAMVPDDIEEAYINQHVSLARPVSTTNLSYLAWFLASREGGQKQFLELQRGATKMGLGLDDIRAVNIPLPPLPEQHRIVEEVERRLSIADGVEAVIDAELKRADRLRQSILKQAFSGKLVPQDPRDEPASVLLERIKEEKARREAETKAKRTGRRARKKPEQMRLL